jgi:hypothetical protein
MWRAVYLSKLLGLERKLKVFFEWTLELLFPRDISLLDIRDRLFVTLTRPETIHCCA